MKHAWRGNVRELENTIHRAVLLATGDEIGLDAIMTNNGFNTDLQRAVEGTANKTDHLVGRTVAAVERDLILDTLNHCLGNRTHAANILGISIRTMRNKLKQYSEDGVKVPHPGEGARATI